MRVAVRRARSALTVFRVALPPGALDPMREGLKPIGSRLGPRRDWDVFLHETMPAIRESLPGDERLDRMMAAAERQRRECGKALADFLGGPAFRTLTIDLTWFVHTLGVEASTSSMAPPTLTEFANHVLTRRYRKLVSSGKTMADMDIPALHGVRLRAKQVRYAAEMFASLRTGKAPKRFIRRLSVLQQRLGVLNDGAVAADLMQQLGGGSGRHAYAVGVVVGFLAARSARTRPRIMRAFEKFRRQPAYWA
jgi:triphosphatase